MDEILLDWPKEDLKAKTSQYLQSYASSPKVHLVNEPLRLQPSKPPVSNLPGPATTEATEVPSSPSRNMRDLATNCVTNLKNSEEAGAEPLQVKYADHDFPSNRMLLNPKNVKFCE
jgi:hypothetical protein